MIFLIRPDSLSWKFVFVTKFACVNRAPKFSAVNLLNSGETICLSCLWSVIFFSVLLTFGSYSVFFNRFLTVGIFFSTEVNEEVVAKPLILGKI